MTTKRNEGLGWLVGLLVLGIAGWAGQGTASVTNPVLGWIVGIVVLVALALACYAVAVVRAVVKARKV